MRISDLVYGRTFQGRILLDYALKLHQAAIRARDRFNVRGQIPSDKTINDMIDELIEIKRRCNSNLSSNRPTKIAQQVTSICDEIFSVLSEINPSILDENLKGK
jgi:hypothetical protein